MSSPAATSPAPAAVENPPSVVKTPSGDALGAQFDRRCASSNGETTLPTRATSLLNLEVKVLTQALGVENQWVERGDGRVEFADLTIRVLSPARGKNATHGDEDTGVGKGGDGENLNDAGSTASTVEDQDLIDTVILEDTITCDTPFVGENCCIVWNSFEQQLSLCLMYASEEGYSASWSALVALQEKAYPLLRFDLLESCRPTPAATPSGSKNETTAGGEQADADANEAPAADAAAAPSPSRGTTASAGEPLPYSYFIHTLYDPPLGFIEMHALSLSILENAHTSNPKLFESSETVVDLLRLASADLLDHLLTRQVFPRMLDCLAPAGESACTTRSASSTATRSPMTGETQTRLSSAADGSAHIEDEDVEEVYGSLSNLEVPENLASFIGKERRLRRLQAVVIPALNSLSRTNRPNAPNATPAANNREKSSHTTTMTPLLTTTTTRWSSTELLLKLSTMSHRLRNEIVCTLLSSDTTLTQARDALTVAPPPTPSGGSFAAGPPSTTRGRGSSASVSSMHSLRSTDRTPSPSGTAAVTLTPSAALTEARKVEQSVLAHLRFFRSLIVISMIELGRELVGPVIAKVYHFGLLEALSLVAERFAMPAGTTAVFLAKLREGSGGGADASATQPFPPSTAGRNSFSGTTSAPASSSTTLTTSGPPVYYSPAIESELTAFLDATLVRLNERQEERLMNELVRAPILADPVKYNGLMTFALRQVLVAPSHASLLSCARLSPSPGPSPPSVQSSAAPSVPTAASVAYRQSLRDAPGVRNTLLLFHLLGLHDDEGSAAMERALDPEGNNLRDRFRTFVMDKYLAHTLRGQIAIPPPPSLLGGTCLSNGAAGGGAQVVASASSRTGSMLATSPGISPKRGATTPANTGTNSAITPIVVFNNASSGGAGITAGMNQHQYQYAKSLSALPAGISPGLISVLNYLVQLCNPSNRDRILRLIFDPKSNVLSYMETCCAIAVNTQSKVVGLDVLTSQVSFLKCILTEVGNACADDAPDTPTQSCAGQDGNPLPSFDSPDPLPANLVSLICRQITVERDTLWYYLRAYNALGGRRRNTVFHSSFLALLELLARGPTPRGEPGPQDEINRRAVAEGTIFHDMRSFVFIKHETALPERFARKVRETLLVEICGRLGCEDPFSSCNNSISALSSTISSETLRSSTKLRFVDELEAVTGGVDGTVSPNTVTSLTAAVVASVSAEEKRRKMSSNARGVTLEEKLHGSGVSSSPLRTAGALANAPNPAPALQSMVLGTTDAAMSNSNATNGGYTLLTAPKKPSSTGRSFSWSSSSARGTKAERKAAATRLDLCASPPPTVNAVFPAALTVDAHAPEVTSTTTTTTTAVATSPPSLSTTSSSPAASVSTSAVLQPTAPKGEKPPTRPRKLTGTHEEETAVHARRPNSVGSPAEHKAPSSGLPLSKRQMTDASEGDAANGRENGKQTKHSSSQQASITVSNGINTVPAIAKPMAATAPASAPASTPNKGKDEVPALVLPRVRKSSE